jgi:hypothetical protein
MIAPSVVVQGLASGSSPALEDADNFSDFGQAFLVVLALEFKPSRNPLGVAYAMLREKAQGTSSFIHMRLRRRPNASASAAAPLIAAGAPRVAGQVSAPSRGERLTNAFDHRSHVRTGLLRNDPIAGVVTKRLDDQEWYAVD